jgi:hypothetical protein
VESELEDRLEEDNEKNYKDDDEDEDEAALPTI